MVLDPIQGELVLEAAADRKTVDRPSVRSLRLLTFFHAANFRHAGDLRSLCGTQKRPPHTPGHTVPIRSHRGIHQLRTCHRYRHQACSIAKKITENRRVTKPVLVFVWFLLYA